MRRKPTTKMNTNPQTSNGTFLFQAVVKFEIDPDTAANLLVESNPIQTVHCWLMTQKPSSQDDPYYGNESNLRDGLGRYLSDKKVAQARALLPCSDVAQLTY